jgi:hypothetical protein
MDYMNHPGRLPMEVRSLVDTVYGRIESGSDPYTTLTAADKSLKKLGWGWDWGLDAEPHNLHPLVSKRSKKG